MENWASAPSSALTAVHYFMPFLRPSLDRRRRKATLIVEDAYLTSTHSAHPCQVALNGCTCSHKLTTLRCSCKHTAAPAGIGHRGHCPPCACALPCQACQAWQSNRQPMRTPPRPGLDAAGQQGPHAPAASHAARPAEPQPKWSHGMEGDPLSPPALQRRESVSSGG